MSLKNRYRTNIKKEEQGVAIPFGVNEDGSKISFTLRRLWRHNKSYSKAVTENLEQYNGIDISLLPDSTAQEILVRSFVQGILVGWENVLLSDVTGNDKDKGFADFNEENAMSLFSVNRGLYDDLYEMSQNIANFKDNELKLKAKN